MLEVDSDGDVLVSVEGTRWMLSPASVTSVTDPDPQQLTEAGDMGSEDPLGTKLWHTCIESLSNGNGQWQWPIQVKKSKIYEAHENDND